MLSLVRTKPRKLPNNEQEKGVIVSTHMRGAVSHICSLRFPRACSLSRGVYSTTLSHLNKPHSVLGGI